MYRIFHNAPGGRRNNGEDLSKGKVVAYAAVELILKLVGLPKV
jgi:hypothetical protein